MDSRHTRKSVLFSPFLLLSLSSIFFLSLSLPFSFSLPRGKMLSPNMSLNGFIVEEETQSSQILPTKSLSLSLIHINTYTTHTVKDKLVHTHTHTQAHTHTNTQRQARACAHTCTHTHTRNTTTHHTTHNA